MTKYRAVSVVLMSILIAAVIVLCALSQSIQNKRAAAKTEESSTLPQVDYVLGEYEGYFSGLSGRTAKAVSGVTNAGAVAAGGRPGSN